MRHIISIIVVLAAFTSLVTAFPFTSSMESPSSVSLLEGMTATLSLNVHNVDFEKHEVKISAKSDSGFITAIPTLKKFSLNGYESTTIGIVVSASDDADHETYDVVVKVDMDGQLVEVPITVYVGNNPYLTVSVFDQSVCGNDYVGTLNVSVKNISGNDTLVLLHGEQPILFPTFQDESFELASSTTEIVSLSISTSPHNIGLHEGTIWAETSQIVVLRPFVVSVNDCPVFPEKTISLTLPKKPKDLKKLQTTLFPITLKNLTTNKQNVHVTVDSIIPANSLDFTLNSLETLTLDLSLFPGLETPAGTYPVKISATAGDYTTSQSVNMKVLPLSYLEAESVSTFYTLVKGQSQDAVFIVHNKGDVSQTVSFGMKQDIPDVDFVFNPSSSNIPAGKSQIVTLSVYAHEDTSVDGVNNFIQINGGSHALSIPLSFDIISFDGELPSVINVVSAPTVLNMVKGQDKTFEITLQNPTDNSIFGVHFKMVGVKGSGLILIGEQNTVLAPHQTRTYAFTLKTSDFTNEMTYYPILVVTSPHAETSIPFTLNVYETGFLAGFTGFLFGAQGIGLGIVVLLILLVLWIIGHFPKKSPAWASKWVK
ncbi:MAG: hypothetical protein V1776_05060 [Candidatus Diapherotrites archaeon]